ncbi:MAG: peptide-methionine (S)-S-oxide reductase [Puniceicoccaceae bacterium]|nr:MAG: peptide-methionine (S)-S-oxide reductase [Puniceicoccaceae bacterium]
MEEIYFAGGCLWGVQEFLRHLPGVEETEAGRANGTAQDTGGTYDGYAECVKTRFDPQKVSVPQLIDYFFEIIDPYAINQQGPDIGEKYRTGIYSLDPAHLVQAKNAIRQRTDHQRIAVEVRPLTNYVRSDAEHQDRLTKNPEEACHLPRALLHKYKNSG